MTNFAGIATNDNTVGTLDWTNLTHVTAADGSYVNNGGGSGSITHYLLTANYGFSIPVGAMITGIVVEVRIKSQFAASVDHSVKLAKAGVIGGTDKATSTTIGTTDTWITYGTSTDLWGQSWTYSDINASTFGVAYSAAVTGSTDSLFLDAVRITIFYAVDGLPSGSYFGLSVDAGGAGVHTWTSAANGENAPDAAYASAVFNTTAPNILRFTQWLGSSVPAGATITGIAVEISWHTDNSAEANGVINLVYSGAAIGTGTHTYTGTPASNPVPSVNAWSAVFGADGDLWGATLSPTIVNDATFGIQVVEGAASSGGSGTLFIDSAKMQVYYTLAGVSTSRLGMQKKMGYFLKQSSTEQILVFRMISSTDHISAVTGLSPTVTLSKAGGSFASPSGAVSEIANGWYKVAGNATDTATLGPLLLHATGTGADPWDDVFEVVAFDPQDATKLGLSALTMPTNFTSLSITGSGDVSVGKFLGTPVTESVGGQIAGGFTKFHDVTGPTGTQERIPHVTLCDTITAYTGNTPQTGDNYARIGPAGVNLTSIGDTRMAFLDAAVSSRLAASAYVSPLTSAAVATAVLDATASSHNTAGTIGAKINSAASAGDPWSTAVPGAYAAGTAGFIVGTNLDAQVSTRSTFAGGAVASVTGNVGGNVVGSVGSVSGAVGSVTGNVGGNVTGSVGSVVADVGITQAGADKVWGTPTRAITDKAGFKLATDGLDSISTTRATGVAATFTQAFWQVWDWMYGKRTLDNGTGQQKTYASDGVTVVTTQTLTDTGGVQTQGKAS